jgi:hypothetical protein
MVHGDDKGLVLPPRVAQLQVVVIPTGITAKTTDEAREKLYDEVDRMAKELVKAGVKAKADLREGYTPAFKYNDWELKVRRYVVSSSSARLADRASSCALSRRECPSVSSSAPRTSRSNKPSQSAATAASKPTSHWRPSAPPSRRYSRRSRATCSVAREPSLTRPSLSSRTGRTLCRRSIRTMSWRCRGARSKSARMRSRRGVPRSEFISPSLFFFPRVHLLFLFFPSVIERT